MQYKKILSKLSEVYLLLFATIHLLYFGFNGYAKIFNAKILTFSVINGFYFTGILITFIAMYLSFDSFDLKPKFKALLHPSRLFALIYLAFTAFSAFGSFYFPLTLNGVSRFEGLLTISIYVFSFIAITCLNHTVVLRINCICALQCFAPICCERCPGCTIS